MKYLGAMVALLLLCAGTLKTDATDLTVANNSPYDLGVCTFSGGGSQVQFEVAANGQYDEPIGFTVDSVTIEGQTVVEPGSGPVVLSNGAEISIQWPSLNDVQVLQTGKTTQPVQ